MHGYMVRFYLWVANISMLFNVFTLVLIKVEIFLASQVLFDRGFSLANNMWQRWCKEFSWETSIYWEVHILSQWLLWLMYLNSWSPASGTVCGGCRVFGHGASLADSGLRVELECSRLHFGWVLSLSLIYGDVLVLHCLCLVPEQRPPRQYILNHESE